MGLGDVKLMMMVGTFVGLTNVGLTIIFSAFVGAVVGTTIALWKRHGLRVEIPYGPYLALAALISLLCGVDLWDWYWYRPLF
jgi:leader peptidase (prepilin peptidase)/N-methyltransferase